MNVRLVTILAVLAVFTSSACGDNRSLDPFAIATATFIDTFCTNPCTTGSEAACRADLAADLADAASTLDDVGREQCAHCLEIKAGLVADVVDCEPTSAQDAEVYAACDLDPDEDSDADGDPTNDHHAACGGAP